MKSPVFAVARMAASWLALALLVLMAGQARAQGPTPIVPLAKNQLIAFLGDSITQQNLYTRDVELLLSARYPELHLRFVNVGWSGRHAAHLMDDNVLRRDLLRLKPDIVLILFGMNDGWYRNPPDEAAMTAFQANMANLVDKIRVALPTARLVLLTPTIVDPSRGGYLKGYNDTLALIGWFMRDLGAQRSVPVIDLHTPMLQVDAAAKAADPKFTMIPDGVHPNPVGHWLMATIISQAFGVTPTDIKLTVDAQASTVVYQSEIAVRDLRVQPDSLCYTTQVPRVPVALPLEARGALSFAPVQAARDRAQLTIPALPPQQLYGVYANELLVGRYTGEELGRGVDWVTGPYETPLTAGLLQHAMAKFNYRWTAWRAPDTGLATLTTSDADKDWQALEAALARLTKREEEAAARELEAARTTRWRVSPEAPLPLPRWEVVGPYNFQSFDVAYPPETDRPLTQTWTPLSANDKGLVDFLPGYGTYRNSVLFARVCIYVPKSARLSLGVGSYGPLKVFVNGNTVIARDLQRTAEPNQDTGTAMLHAGWNVLLVRERRGDFGWGFYPQAFLSGLTTDELAQVKVAIGQP